MSAISVTERVMAQLTARMPPGMPLELPPKIFVDMEGEMLEYIEGKSLRVRFPVRERYQNPLGYMQGGMITAAIDCTVGPLSYLVAPPSVTLQLQTSYIRPITRDEPYIEVEGVVIELTRRQIFMTAHVYTSAGKLAATAHTSCMLLE